MPTKRDSAATFGKIDKAYFVLLALFAMFFALALWLQHSIVQPARALTPATPASAPKNSADYWIENLVSTGIDADGKKYQLRAALLVHDARRDRTMLNRPSVIQFATSGGEEVVARHLEADCGVLYNNEREVLLYGNVRLRDNAVAGAEESGARMVESVTTTETLRITLRDAPNAQSAELAEAELAELTKAVARWANDPARAQAGCDI